jgi:hypothetical protein
VGSHAANFLVLAKFAHLKQGAASLDDWESPQTAWEPSSSYRRFIKKYENAKGEAEFAVAASRAWWLGRYSGHHFWNAYTPYGADQSAGDLAIALMTPFHGNSHTPRWEQRHTISNRIQSYISHVESPSYPQQVAYQMAQRGMQLYASHCSRCHGVIELNDPNSTETSEIQHSSRFVLKYNQSEARTSYDEVGTDRLYWEQSSNNDWIVDNVNAIPQAIDSRIRSIWPRRSDQPTIMAPPLIGLWASAPYLHNGAVPTVYGVLHSASRPTIWKMSDDPFAYDYRHLGVAHTRVEANYKKQQPSDWLIYDTRNAENGMTNGGHEFGDHLSDAERMDLIEFLKVLETRNVAAAVELDPHSRRNNLAMHDG